MTTAPMLTDTTPSRKLDHRQMAAEAEYRRQYLERRKMAQTATWREIEHVYEGISITHEGESWHVSRVRHVIRERVMVAESQEARAA